MSKVSKKIIKLNPEVEMKLEGKVLTAKGPRGELSLKLPEAVDLEIKEGAIEISLSSRLRGLSGLYVALIMDLMVGVRRGFRKDLELVGVGFKAKREGRDLVLNLGFSHPVKFSPPVGVEVEVKDETHLFVVGSSAQLVGETAARLRSLKKPEPYKGKGIKYAGEIVRRKAGKAAKAGAVTK